MNRARAYGFTASIPLWIVLTSGPLGPLQGAAPPNAAAAQGGAAQSPAGGSLNPAPALQASTDGQTAAGLQYTGELISLNLKDVDLKDFFRLIHEISGLNIIVDPNVSGTLTMVLDNVPWDQALDIVLRNNGLDKALDGNVLRIARIDTLAAEADSRTKLARAQADAAGLVTVVRYLQYATASDVLVNNANVTAAQTGSSGAATGGGVQGPSVIFGVATVLKNMGRSILSPRGMITADPRDNAVVITDIPSQIPIIQAIVDKLDRKSKQVSISARMVLTTSDVVRQLQTSLSGSLNNRSGSVTTTGSSGTTATGFGSFALANVGGLYAINLAIAAAETRNLAKTISAPTIVTQNNVPGLVQQGTQLFIQTVVNNTVTSVPVNASLALAVTPQITDDNHIFLNIQVQNNSPGPVVAQNPEINIQSATTQVVVPDGGVVVFGGIKITSNTKTLNQVPGLSSIPVLGNLFKSTLREDQENELIFIVTPKIIPG